MWITPPSQPVSIRRKWNAVLTVFFFIIMFLPVSTYAADTIVNYDYTQEITDLTKNYDSILDYTESKRCVAYSDQDKTLCSTYEDTILYLYKTDTSAPPGVINKNTEQLNDTTYKIYSSDVYYQDEQDLSWKQTEYGVIEKMDFQAVQDYELKTVDEVSLFNNPFKIYKVNAQSFTPGMDGESDTYDSYNADYPTARAAGSSAGRTTYSSNPIYVRTATAGGYFWFSASFITFDTSSLDLTGYTIASSSLFLYSTSASTNPSYVRLYESNQASPTSLAYTDYKQWGTTQLATELDFYGAGYKRFVLNTDGKGLIDDTGYTMYALVDKNYDTSTQSASLAEIRPSEQSGTNNDPYLLIDLEEEEATSTPEATTTLDTLPSLPFIDDLTVITGRTDHYESSTTAADWSELHYYRVPAFLWWILTSTFLFILGFILSQIQRILRKKK